MLKTPGLPRRRHRELLSCFNGTRPRNFNVTMVKVDRERRKTASTFIRSKYTKMYCVENRYTLPLFVVLRWRLNTIRIVRNSIIHPPGVRPTYCKWYGQLNYGRSRTIACCGLLMTKADLIVKSWPLLVSGFSL